MRTWKNYLCMLAALVVTLGFTSCESDEDIGFDLSGLYGVTWFGDMGAGDSWGEPLDSYITFTSGSRPTTVWERKTSIIPLLPSSIMIPINSTGLLRTDGYI